MRYKGARRIKGVHDIKGMSKPKGLADLLGSSPQSTVDTRPVKPSQPKTAKDSPVENIEQVEQQEDRIKEGLSEAAQELRSEVPKPEQQPEEEHREESSGSETHDTQTDKIEVDAGSRKFSFGGLLQGIGSFLDLASEAVAKLEEEGKEEVRREGEFRSPSGRIRAIYGLSIKEGIGGKPAVEPFGNVKTTAQGPVVEEVREPLADVFDEKDHISVIVELPGVQTKNIDIKVTGDILTLSAVGSNHKYYKEVVLPKEVDSDTLKTKYKNGILEIRMVKK